MGTHTFVDLIWYFPNSISVNGGPYHEMNHGVNDVGPNIGTKTPTSPYPLVPNVTRKHDQVLKDGYTVNVLSAESTDECLRTKSKDNQQ